MACLTRGKCLSTIKAIDVFAILPMSLPARLLGFAFANADFLFEVDRSGTVIFAAGAAKDDAWVVARTLPPSS